MTDVPPKSALEIAMERLRRQDEAEGIVERLLSHEQKAAIAEARQVCSARLAELEILHKSKLATVGDPAERALLEAEHRRDMERLTGERDRQIERIRRGEPA